jgi:hypothetical protein
MSGILYQAAIAAFPAWLSAVGGGVEVVNGGLTTKGIRKVDNNVELGREMQAPVSGHVRILTGSIGELAEDGEITVDGKRVYITGIDTDVAGAITRIDYTESRAVPEEYM